MNYEEKSDIREMIKEYLLVNGYKSSYENFLKEEKSVIKTNVIVNEKKSKIYSLLQKEKYFNSEIAKNKEIERKYLSIKQCSRQLISISEAAMKDLCELEDVSDEELLVLINKYKSYLGNYYKIIIEDEWNENVELLDSNNIIAIKNEILRNKESKNNEKLIENFYSLHVHSLEIAVELRRTHIINLISNDIFFFNYESNGMFLINLLKLPSYTMRHAILSIISIVASSKQGVEYLIQKGASLVQKIISIMKSQDDGTVIQKLCIVNIFKMTIKENVIDNILKQEYLEWIVHLFQRIKIKDIDMMILEYVSLTLINILTSEISLQYLDNNTTLTNKLFNCLLNFIKDSLPYSILINFVIILKMINLDRYSVSKSATKFEERLKDFLTYFTGEKYIDENEKKDVIELCKIMCFPKEKKQTNSSLKSSYDVLVKEFVHDDGSLVFEYLD